MTALGTTATGELNVDVRGLIEGRLLIQANSGGGKSYLVRKLLEVTNGQVQHLVLDVEGDFVTLRERYPYVLAGTGGEAAAHPSSAGVLARKLLELRASAIVDLSDLHVSEREEFVRLFVEELMDAPRELWAPALVVIDEAHMFAPQSAASASLDAVRDLAVRGRKRGLAVVLATQRLSSLDKGVADVGNVLIGRTGLDVDQKRAAGILGLTSAVQRQQLALLEPGTFYAYGPAFGTSTPVRMTVGKVETRHPQLGDRAYDPPPAPEGIREMLAALATVQTEAVEEAHTVEQLKAEIAKLRNLATAEKSSVVQPCDHEATLRQQSDEIGRLRDDLEAERRESQRVHEAFVANRDRLAGKVAAQIYDLSFVSRKEPTHAPKEAHETGPERVALAPDGVRRPGRSEPESRVGRATTAREQAAKGPAPKRAATGRDTNDMKDEEVAELVKQEVRRQYESAGRVLVVPAAEVIRKSYQGAAVQRIVASVEAMGPDEREAYRYLLSRDVFVGVGEMSQVMSGYKGGAAQVKWGSATKKLEAAGFIVKGGSGNVGFKPNLHDWVAEQLSVHQPSKAEIDEIFDAVLARLVGGAA